MAQPDKKPHAESKTRAPRTSVMLTTHVFPLDGGDPSAHRVVNLSATGVCIAQPAGLATGAMVAVSIGRVDHAPADIIWVRGGLAGLRFRRPIDLPKARMRRVGGAPTTPPGAGWLRDLGDAYRR